MRDSTASASTFAPSPANGDEPEHAFVRRMSELIEECGHPCIAGRIVGWLLVSDPPEQSFGELVEATGASKGSISTMTRRLEEEGLVERLDPTNDRQTYFRLRPGAWRTMLRRRMALVRDLAGVAEHGLHAMDDPPSSVRCRLQEMHDFHAFFAERMPALIEEYEAEQKERRARFADEEAGSAS